MKEMDALSLYDLNVLVRRSLEQCLPDTYWIQAELSDVRTNSTGHCYLEFVQKDARSNSLIAKARGTIWSNVFRLLKPYFEEATGQAFVSGIKVLVQVTVSFHELYGYSLTVQDIDPTYTLGDMARTRHSPPAAARCRYFFFNGCRVWGLLPPVEEQSGRFLLLYGAFSGIDAGRSCGGVRFGSFRQDKFTFGEF